jgi:hypothetical protein
LDTDRRRKRIHGRPVEFVEVCGPIRLALSTIKCQAERMSMDGLT